MSPRPRKVTDDEIYLAAQRAISRLGPGELTLADIAKEAGVAFDKSHFKSVEV